MLLLQAPSKLVQELIEKIAADLDGLLGDLGKEMKSIADYWQIDLGIVVSLNFAYELRRVCTTHGTGTCSASLFKVHSNFVCFGLFLADRRRSSQHNW